MLQCLYVSLDTPEEIRRALTSTRGQPGPHSVEDRNMFVDYYWTWDRGVLRLEITDLTGG